MKVPRPRNINIILFLLFVRINQFILHQGKATGPELSKGSDSGWVPHLQTAHKSLQKPSDQALKSWWFMWSGWLLIPTPMSCSKHLLAEKLPGPPFLRLLCTRWQVWQGKPSTTKMGRTKSEFAWAAQILSPCPCLSHWSPWGDLPPAHGFLTRSCHWTLPTFRFSFPPYAYGLLSTNKMVITFGKKAMDSCHGGSLISHSLHTAMGKTKVKPTRVLSDGPHQPGFPILCMKQVSHCLQ